MKKGKNELLVVFANAVCCAIFFFLGMRMYSQRIDASKRHDVTVVYQYIQLCQY